MATRDTASQNDDMPRVELSSRLLGAEITDDPFNPLRPILQTVENHHQNADLDVVHRAYNRANYQHRNQRRRSGEPYIIHPLAVSQILADLGMTDRVVAAGLLHDTVEDTDYTLEQCRQEFGDTIAGLVDGVTKISKIEYGDSAQAETIRKLVIAMSKDVRVLVVKLADRVHNARTWRYVEEESANRKARETLDIYAPLANRLGINAIKSELEELSFKQLQPKIYNEIVVMVGRRAGQRDVYLKSMASQIRFKLKEQHIRAAVMGRPKDYFSIYQKMVLRGHNFEDIYDLMGIRIIVDTVQDCYAALGMVHSQWTPIPGRFKDYIAMPKLNMYQSLHTTVFGPEGKPIEIQIRTWEMHRQAEYGIAAHWKYKANGQAGRDLSMPDRSDTQRAASADKSEEDDNFSSFGTNRLRWIQHLADWSGQTPDSDEFLGTLTQDLSADDVYAFTPKGKIISLTTGSTPVDFAYAIHTEVGNQTMGARINGRLVPLDTPLSNGDIVEILTSKATDAGPSYDWLSFVKSPKARSKIKRWFNQERRSEAVENGRHKLTRALRRRNLPVMQLLTETSMVSIADELDLPDPDALFVAIGAGNVSVDTVIKHLISRIGWQKVDELVTDYMPHVSLLTRPTSARQHRTAPSVLVKGEKDIWVKLARCCNPVPGDTIVGFVTRSQGVSVHRADCENVRDLKRKQPEHIIDVSWSGSTGTFLIRVQVEALDRPQLLANLATVLADCGISILSGQQQVDSHRVVRVRFEFEMGGTKHLARILSALQKVEGVFNVYRLTGFRKKEDAGCVQ
ncbi:MAG: bifunctional (p)ppGpp synthetase/guanosine-3',5'-bis(diphosphate) 3'-pyrophosphohydrolase [Bifidobacteriaceae bacterium]|nr:bifunctional (p)ppGpp synthetase/guanosine-3',5'-bis(diphosphate) 3'-pyrophosphohydrolase [Bifidobacteriaceae bacterium]